jgi:hypothetical protein
MTVNQVGSYEIAMTIDIQTARQRLIKAKEDVDFYANLVRILSDPRLAGMSAPAYAQIDLLPTAPPPATQVSESDTPVPTAKRSPRGEVRRKVSETLPKFGSEGITTSQIHETICATGYQFVSKHPLMAINDALAELETQGEAQLVGRRGVTNFWSKPRPQP